MRDLTPEELKLAPDWSTHYDADYSGSHRIQVCFFDNERAVDLLRIGFIGEPYANEEGILSTDREIPERKPFDITKHEVSEHVTVLESGELGVFDSGWIIGKDRAIAIAKALGVTGEDFK